MTRSAYQVAVDLLSRREHAATELMQKLMRKGADHDEALLAIERLQQSGYQSDERFCEHYIRHCIAKGQGPVRIRQQLRERGVSDLLINEQLSEHDPQWGHVLRDVWQKKFNAIPQTIQDRQKQMRFLFYRGFSSDSIQRLLNHSLDE